MYFRALVTGSNGKIALRIESDEYNLGNILTEVGNRYGWVFEKVWKGEHIFTSAVGTEYQWEHSSLGRLTITAIEKIEAE